MVRNVLWILGISFLLIACSDDASSLTGATSLADLPKATGVTTASASVSLNGKKAAELQSATTGTRLSQWYTAFNGQTAKSQTFCQFGLIVKEVIRAASQPDKIACYLGVMERYSSLSGWPTDAADGSYKYITLAGAGGDRANLRIKTRITKSGSVITGFEMFTGNEGAAQTEYILMSQSGSTINLTSVQYYNGGGNTHRGRVTVTGSINSSGVWTTPKAIVAQSSRTETGNNRTENTRIDLTQYSDRFQVSGYNTGSDNGNSYTNSVYSLVQLLNPTPVGTTALGEGTAKMSMSHASYGSFSQTRGWNGDTGLPISPATTADYYSTVDAATLPSAPSSYDTTFAASETWDLTTPAGATNISADFAAIQANAAAASDFTDCNTDFGFEEEDNWPNCWSLSDN